MKKLITLTLIFIIMAILLVSCGSNLSAPKNGTYKSEGLISQTWTFSGKNEVTLVAIGGIATSRGTYSINGDKLTVTSTMWGTTTTSTYTITEITSKSFYIDGTKFIKQ